MEALFKPHTVPGSGAYANILIGENVRNSDAAVMLWLTNNSFQGFFYSGAARYTPEQAVVADNWYHGAMHFKGSWNFAGFLNGEKTTNETIAATVNRNVNYWQIGNWQGVANREFDGLIGEIRASSVLRSDAWIRATYHTLFGTLVSFDVLIVEAVPPTPGGGNLVSVFFIY